MKQRYYTVTATITRTYKLQKSVSVYGNDDPVEAVTDYDESDLELVSEESDNWDADEECNVADEDDADE